MARRQSDAIASVFRSSLLEAPDIRSSLCWNACNALREHLLISTLGLFEKEREGRGRSRREEPTEKEKIEQGIKSIHALR